ncbi:MAG: serine/threonine-protein phosphatase [Rhodobacteraceae bacterium]|jgi:protein phosphatase|nr:serine/threonine-protein phosphatase [Paracoccaceae bacterium]
MIEAPFLFETGAASDTGRVRNHNEDSFLTQPESGVWLVADGMGGHQAGDFASRTIAESVASVGRPASAPDLQARFLDRVARAHAIIQDQSRRLNGATVGATLVALLTYDRHFACIWSGDSRIYLLRGGQFQQVTTDHTEVNELLRQGAISAEQAASWPRRNVITRAIGVHDRPMTDEIAGALAHGDTFLLCSDGLTEHVEDREMAEALSTMAPQQACDALVQTTLARGAKDNVTVVVVRAMDRQAAALGAQPQGHRASGGDEWHVDA